MSTRDTFNPRKLFRGFLAFLIVLLTDVSDRMADQVEDPDPDLEYIDHQSPDYWG